MRIEAVSGATVWWGLTGLALLVRPDHNSNGRHLLSSYFVVL
jgi:hypothetical protein